MIWSLYECLVDGFAQVKKGDKFKISGESAKLEDGESLAIVTKYVRNHSTEGEEGYEFKFLGEEDTEAEPPKKEKKEKKEKKKEVDDHFVIINDKVLHTGTLAQCKKFANELELHGEIMIAKKKNTLTVTLTRTWEG